MVMKMNIRNSIMIALMVTGIWYIINWVCAQFFEMIPFAIATHGGEITTYNNIGFSLEKVYPLNLDSGVVTIFHTDYFMLGVFLLVVFAVSVLVTTLVDKKKNK